MHEGFLCVRRPGRHREGFWPVGLKEVPDYCPSPAENLQGLPVASSVKASLLAWHLRPCQSEPSTCSSHHLYSVPPRWVPPRPGTRHVVPSPHLVPYRCPHLKPLSPCALPTNWESFFAVQIPDPPGGTSWSLCLRNFYGSGSPTGACMRLAERTCYSSDREAHPWSVGFHRSEFLTRPRCCCCRWSGDHTLRTSRASAVTRPLGTVLESFSRHVANTCLLKQTAGSLGTGTLGYTPISFKTPLAQGWACGV